MAGDLRGRGDLAEQVELGAVEERVVVLVVAQQRRRLREVGALHELEVAVHEKGEEQRLRPAWAARIMMVS